MIFLFFLCEIILFFENFPILGLFRNLADFLIVIVFFCFIYEWVDKRNIKLTSSLSFVFMATFFVYAMNFILGFKNVEASVSYLIEDSIPWIIDDRHIDKFITLGDLYRNSLIYSRYLLIPVYFIAGNYISNYLGLIRVVKITVLMLFVTLILNCISGFYYGNERLSGAFENTATLSSLGILVIFLFSISFKSWYSVIGIVMSLMAVLLTQTISAMLALFFFVIFAITNNSLFYKVLTLTVIAISLSVGFLLLWDPFLSFLSSFVYIGSFLNRLYIWSALLGSYNSSAVFLLGLGSFPLFTDNIFYWLFSGFGVFSFVYLYYFYSIDEKYKYARQFGVLILSQGLLFPGFVMPYMLFTTFFLLGILSNETTQ